MGDRRRDRTSRISRYTEIPATLPGLTPGESAQISELTAAAQILHGSDVQRPYYGESWHDEVWDFYSSLGEFNFGVEWFSEALSRVRLVAARVTPGGDEPEVLTDGPAAEIVASLVGGTDGQSQLLRSMGIHISVPGDCYFVGREVQPSDIETGVLLDAEPDGDGRVWTVQPTNTLRRSRSRFMNMFKRNVTGWDMQVDDATWITLPDDALVCRIWDRNERYPWRSNSPARAALPIMREIDMYNRYIIAVMISRVALNGILFMPDEVTMPASPQYQNSVDPFVAELIDIMRSAIKNPGSPASAAPVPVRIPAEFIEKFRHMTFATPLDQKIFEHRQQAIQRLAGTLNLPAEVVTGMGDTNHWSAWNLTETAIKIHVAPKAEIVTRGLTLGYLHPVLRSLGEDPLSDDGERIIVWYDTSELTQRPDRSALAVQLREMLVISDAATRRETGFDEADAPTDPELEKMVLMKLAVNPQTAAPALKELTGLELEMPAAPSALDEAPVTDDPAEVGGPVDDGASGSSVTGPPNTLNDEPAPVSDVDVTPTIAASVIKHSNGHATVNGTLVTSVVSGS